MRWSIAPEVDFSFWLDSGFREQSIKSAYGMNATEAFHDNRLSSGRCCVLWSVPLPLGIASAAVEQWRTESGLRLNEADVCARIEHLVRLVCADDRQVGGEPYDAAGRPVVCRSGRACRVAAGGGPRLLLGADAQALAAEACRAAALLQGRALLAGEALALLAAAGSGGAAPPGGAPQEPWSAAAPALQLAALLGRLRLGRALAPQARQAAPALPRLRGAAPRAAALRCMRCGSGAARMRRTPCAACGRMCAYCEACLAMGRSRECGLLILGLPDKPLPPAVTAAEPAQKPGPPQPRADSAAIRARLAPWKLSAAQEAAAAAALRYIESDDFPVDGRNGFGSRFSRRFHALAARAEEGPRVGTRASELPVPGTKQSSRLSASSSSTASRGLRELARPLIAAWRSAVAGCAAALTAAGQTADRTGRPKRRFLLWAVTGAGKTEMMFPLIESSILRGGRALIATPRRDVVLELEPRIRRAFPDRSVTALYGGSPQRWDNGEITLATTHQLLRFAGAFDLVVIDELDAFPFHGDPMLHYAAEKVCAPDGVTVLLTATPPASLRREAEKGRLAHARVPVRFHRHPLPVPVTLRLPPVQELLRRHSLPRPFSKAIRSSVDRGAQLFVFVQKIAHIDSLVKRLRQLLPDVPVGGTSSKDGERRDKVLQFRDRTIRVLVTTTILERGVTVPKSDVFILDADSQQFDDAALVQMAGRAGRAKDDPAGSVYFCAPARTRSQRLAIRQIRRMNALAARKGYLHPANS